MSAVRSAIVLLALGLLTSPPAASASTGGAGSGQFVAVTASPLDSQIAAADFIPLPDPSTWSPRMRRKARLKAVLVEETNRDLEETDLGPVHVPHLHDSRPSIQVASPSLPKTCHLRC